MRFKIQKGKVYNICQNKKCGKLFIPDSPNWNRVLYCCPKCARKANYIRQEGRKLKENSIKKILNTRTP